MSSELLIPVLFFAIVAVIVPALILAGLIIFAAHEAVERRRSELATATEVDRAFSPSTKVETPETAEVQSSMLKAQSCL
jgi:flagellar biosynthesis protein FlhB